MRKPDQIPHKTRPPTVSRRQKKCTIKHHTASLEYTLVIGVMVLPRSAFLLSVGVEIRKCSLSPRSLLRQNKPREQRLHNCNVHSILQLQLTFFCLSWPLERKVHQHRHTCDANMMNAVHTPYRINHRAPETARSKGFAPAD